MNDEITDMYETYVRTHNKGVLSVYTEEIKNACDAGIITGLPENYGRGRHIGDYRRVALYGVDYLLEIKKRELSQFETSDMTNEVIAKREEIALQMEALLQFKAMCKSYGVDVQNQPKMLRKQFSLFILHCLGRRRSIME